MNTKASILRREKRLEPPKRTARKPPTNAPANDLALSDVVTLPPTKLPSPWLYDSQCLLRDLDRIREAILRIPLHMDTHGPINDALSTAWDVRQQLQYLIGLYGTMQQSWRAKATATTDNNLEHRDAGRQTQTRPVKAHRRDAARVA